MNRKIVLPAVLAGFLASTGCASVPADLDLGMKHATNHDAFVVELEPPATPAAINQMHAWRIKLATASGEPVPHARIGVDGGIPRHGHGLPTQPRDTRELAQGTYLLEGMKFSMTGWWEIKLAIQTPTGSDNVTFNTLVSNPSTAR